MLLFTRFKRKLVKPCSSPYLDGYLRFLLPDSLWPWSTVIICNPWVPNTTGGSTLSSVAFSSARKGLKVTVICRFDPLAFILKDPGSKCAWSRRDNTSPRTYGGTGGGGRGGET